MFLRSDIAREMLLSKRDDSTSDDLYHKAISFGESFKSWNTCMANLGCKIIAIVGIVLAAILAFTIITWVIRIIWCGAEASCWLCGKCCTCCAGDSDSRNRRSAPVNIYNIPQQQPYYAGPPANNHGLPPMPSARQSNYRPLKDEEIEMGRLHKNY
ncbi:hypothetical protein V1514DRAFT_354711 [Lipomyces japonicus]|uniref:uncharacterized protein n=1 Tax=Lipomyces japonicus TaxID=56871 RepID=UPI0034CEE63D